MAHYEIMTDTTHADAVCEMMQALYVEDPAASGNFARDFYVTIETLLSDPSRGQIVLIFEDQRLMGYAILTPHWSNEFIGIILFVDELYVIPDSRGHGIGRGLFSHIERDRPYDAVAIFLEVSASNSRASKLYQSIDFSERTNKTMVKRIL